MTGIIIEVDFTLNRLTINETEEFVAEPQLVCEMFANAKIAYADANKLIFVICDGDADEFLKWSEVLIRTDNIMAKDADMVIEGF